MLNILVIEDDLDLIKLMQAQFHSEINAKFTYASSYSEGMSLVSQRSFDLYLIDIKLDEYSGLDILRVLQKEKNITNRVMVMSASKNNRDEITAYELGAANFLLKPLNFDILRSILKKNIRALSEQESLQLTTNDLILDITGRSCALKNADQVDEVHLSYIEFNILHKLMKSPGVVISKDDLSFLGKDRNEPMSFKALEMHIASLRKKIGNNKIITKRNIGYYFKA